MKKRFLPLLIAVLVLMTAVTAHAAVKIELYNIVLTGDESVGVDLPLLQSKVGDTGAQVGKAPDTVITVEDDGSGTNYAYKLIGGQEKRQQMAVNLYTKNVPDRNFLKDAPYQKFVAKVYLSDLTGTVQLFNFGKAYDSNISSDTAGVYLLGGGAYYYDCEDKNRVCFIENGTIEAEKWYTVEVIYSLEATKVVDMAASVYDEKGMIIGTSPMTKVSELGWNGNRFLRTFLSAENLSADGYVLFDDIALYKLSEIPSFSAPDAEYDKENGVVNFTFAEDIDTGVITSGNVNVLASNPELDITGKYTVAAKDNTMSVDVSKLPYNETFTISVFGYAIDGKAQCEITTPEDPFESAVTGVAFNDGEAIAAGDSVVATVSLTNNSNTGRDYMLLVTSWNSKNECVAIRNVVGYIKEGADPVKIPLPAVPFEDAGSIIRVSLLDNWYNMTPVGDVVTFELGGE